MDVSLTFPFCKYEGAGNDFIMINNVENLINHNFKRNHSLIFKLCHRRFGIGADGLIILEQSNEYEFKMMYYNADGKEGTLCGNGARCAVAFAKANKLLKGNLVCFEACDGIHNAEIVTYKEIGHRVESVIKINMNDVPQVSKLDEDNYFLDTGSPHHVMLVKSVDNYDVEKVGSDIRHSDIYKGINGTNVNFVQTQLDGCIKVRTFERGVEKETLACGTGAVACAVVYMWNKQLKYPQNDDSVTLVKMPGGTLEVSFILEKEGMFKNVYLTGSANKCFSGIYTVIQ